MTVWEIIISISLAVLIPFIVVLVQNGPLKIIGLWLWHREEKQIEKAEKFISTIGKNLNRRD